MKQNIYDLVGEFAITSEDGDKLLAVLKPEIDARHEVELDFTGVAVFASPFFNSSIGRLFADISREQLSKLLKIHNLNNVGQIVLNRVIKNSEEYYRNPEARKALDRILAGENDDAS